MKKIIQSYHGVFKSIYINQSESSTNYKATFIFFDINQSESSIASQVTFAMITNPNEVFTDFRKFFRWEQNYVYETSQSVNFFEFFRHN